MKRLGLIVFAMILLGLSIILILGSSRRPAVITNIIDFPDHIRLSTGEEYSLSLYEASLNRPVNLIMGSESHVTIDVHPLGSPSSGQFPLMPGGLEINLESKLEIPNASIAPSGLVHSLLKSTQDTRLIWNISTNQSSSLSGTLWIYLLVKPTTSSTVMEEIPIFAIPLDISVITVLGLPADTALIFGILSGLLAIVVTILAVRLNFFKQRSKSTK